VTTRIHSFDPSGSRLLIAERFVAPCAKLAELELPLDVIARQPLGRLLLLVASTKHTRVRRVTILPQPELSDRDTLRLTFDPFDSASGETFLLGVMDVASEIVTVDDALVQWVRSIAGDRTPIELRCSGVDQARVQPDRVRDEHHITVMRQRAQASLRTEHMIDAFWCDAFGIYLRGWVHAYEHRVHALRLESAGRSARIDSFSDRPDLLNHYPEHEHVRYGGFSIYLGCPPGHPATLVVETDAGAVTLPFTLPEGPVPRWPEEPHAGDANSPVLQRFLDLANTNGGRVLQIGSRVPAGAAAVPPRERFRGRVIGVDIHPGANVDLVGDAHTLSRFLRAGSFEAVLSASVLEHIQAPWIVAAEINRVLKVGGLVYHHVPFAWPGHAQPNDFWRFSSEGLRVLFGPATGFEILEAVDSGRTGIIPSPDWRKDFLEMPTIPAMGLAEILARKIADIPSEAIAWPLPHAENELRSHRYPVDGLRPVPRETRS
jgi:SAM-dependent methyltransferase